MEQDTNGNVKWRDLEERDRYLAESLDKRLDRAHVYANERLDHISKGVEHIESRIDAVESVIDQQRGARNLVYLLIGSNMLLVVVAFVTIFSGIV